MSYVMTRRRSGSNGCDKMLLLLLLLLLMMIMVMLVIMTAVLDAVTNDYLVMRHL